MQDKLELIEITLLAMKDPKGKGTETPLSNPKKRKLVKASEGEPKKKLMASTVSAVKTVEVHHWLCLVI